MKVVFPLVVALVDDSKVALKIYEQYLQDSPQYKVLSYECPKELLRDIKENSQVVNIVITDINMPNMSGDTLLRELQDLRQAIEVIIVTGESSLITSYASFKAGARSILLKPFSKELLLEVIGPSAKHFENWNKFCDYRLKNKT